MVETRAGATSAAKAIIRAFDAARTAAYGEAHRRPHPHAKDLVFAQRWLAAGADVDLCDGVFAGTCRTMAMIVGSQYIRTMKRMKLSIGNPNPPAATGPYIGCRPGFGKRRT